MEATPQLLPIEKNGEQIKKEVLTNIFKMLRERKLIDNIEDFIKNVTLSGTIFKVDTKNGTYDIKIYNNQLTSLNKAPEIDDFLSSSDNHKILVVTAINNKTKQLILSKYSNVEVFLERTLMINLIDHIMIPKHEVLTDEEAYKLLTEYDIKKKKLPKILLNDPVAEYYNMKVGQICRIIRSSETAGLGVAYRVVVKPVIIQK